MAAHQTPPSLGFPRQEYWSGWPFPSPTHESGKWKLKVKAKSCPTLSDPMDCSLLGSSVHGIFQAKSTGVGCHCLLCWLNKTWDKNCLSKPEEFFNDVSSDPCLEYHFAITQGSTMDRSGDKEGWRQMTLPGQHAWVEASHDFFHICSPHDMHGI